MDKHIKLACYSFQAFNELLGEVDMTTAEVDEHLMAKTLSKDTEIHLNDLIKALEKVRETDVIYVTSTLKRKKKRLQRKTKNKGAESREESRFP